MFNGSRRRAPSFPYSGPAVHLTKDTRERVADSARHIEMYKFRARVTALPD